MHVPAYEPLDLNAPSLFSRMDLQADKDYDLSAYDLTGCVGITIDTQTWHASHLYIRVLQAVQRLASWLFNGDSANLDPYLVHGFGVMGPTKGGWIVGHQTWDGSITSKRKSLANLSAWDQGTRIWYCSHKGVRFWTSRVLQLMCVRKESNDPRSAFSNWDGAMLMVQSPQLTQPNDWELTRRAAAVADILHGDQIHTPDDQLPSYTCIGFLAETLTSAIEITLLSSVEREKIEAVQERALRIDAIKTLMLQPGHALNDFVTNDSIGLQNNLYARPATFARALDFHATLLNANTLLID